MYGLSGNAYDEAAVLKIFRTKQRPRFDPLIVHASGLEQTQDFVLRWPSKARKLAQHFWPGPLTLLLEKKPKIPDIVTAGLPRVGVRVPNHSLTLQLLRALSFPLAAPSANPFGYISPTTPQHVQAQLGERISYILDGGACVIGIESTIVGFEQEIPVVYRLGGISVADIEQVIGSVQVALQTSAHPQAPGMLLSHYAPRKPLIVGELPILLEQYKKQRVGVLAFSQPCRSLTLEQQVVLSPSGSLEEAATNFFAALRTLDTLPISTILASRVPDIGIGQAINERLARAAHRSR